MQPTGRTVLLWLSGLPLALLPAVLHEGLWPAWVAYLVACAGLTVCDAALLVPPGRVRLESRAPEQIYAGTERAWRLGIEVRDSRRALSFDVLADVGEGLPRPDEQTVTVPPGGRGELSFALRPQRRGTVRLERVWLRWRGPFGLMAVTRPRPVDAAVAVVPDVGTVRAMAARFFGSPTALAGLKTERYVGDGSEFESLRQFVAGLDVRSIDWKASARHRRLLCRRFRAERNHRVVLAIDTGHLMREPLAGAARLDHAINRALLLAYLCLKTGDRVGLYAFAARPHLYVEPVAGVRGFERLRAESAALDYGTDETNFTLAAIDLSTRLRRRSLIVVFSEFVDTVTAELMVDNLGHLANRHVIVFVSLRDPALDATERSDLQRLSDLNRAVVAAELGRERDRVLTVLQRSGVHVVDAEPDNVSMALLNRYLDIKRRELV